MTKRLAEPPPKASEERQHSSSTDGEASPHGDDDPLAEVPATHKHEDCEPARGVRFAFGPEDQYFLYWKLNGYSQWTAWKLKSVLRDPDIGNEVGSVAMTADGGTMVTCLSRASDEPATTTVYSGPSGIASAFELAYQPLWKKVQHGVSPSSLSKTILSLGPQGSYYCRNGDGVLSRDLPQSLERRLRGAKSEPVQVSLGRKGTWVCLWPDHTFSYDLGTEYSDLRDCLARMKSDNEGIAFVALNAYETESWFLVDCDGFWRWSFKNFSEEQGSRIRTFAIDWMQKYVRKTGATFTNVNTHSGKTRSVTIGPDTHHDEHSVSDFGSKPLATIQTFTKAWTVEWQSKPWLRSYKHTAVFPAATVGLSTTAITRLSGVPTARAVAAGLVSGALTYGVLSAYT